MSTPLKILSLLTGMALIVAATLAGHQLRPLTTSASAALSVADIRNARVWQLDAAHGSLRALNVRSGISELGQTHDDALQGATALQFDDATQQLRVLTASGWQIYDARALRLVSHKPQSTTVATVQAVTANTKNP